MADDAPRTFRAIPQADSPKEDAETKATREELKQTAISDKPTATDRDEQMAKPPKLNAVDISKATDDTLKEKVSSPKKKRAHDQLDENREPSSSESTGSLSPKDGSSRSDRLEPEKKRPRDEQAEAEDQPEVNTTDSTKSTKESVTTQEPKDSTLSGSQEKPASEKTTFATSGFAKLSGSVSPFGSLGAGVAASPFGALGSSGNTMSGFGALSSSASPSPFGALGAGTSGGISAAPKLTFGPPSDGPASASPFASLNGGAPKAFGSPFGSGFGGGLGTSKLTSFGKPGGGLLKNDKPARPFGAPESDNEASDDGEDGTETGDDGDAPEESETEEKAKVEDDEADQTKSTGVEDKKKAPKLQKVAVDDGEAEEATIFMARAKVYHLDKESGAWKERGAGILKLNVPEATIDFDQQSGAPLTASFDASMLDAGDSESKTPKVVRLIMRQDHTLRIVINTAVVAGTDFVRREMMKAVGFLFTALEGPDAHPVTLQIKMSVANAEIFQQTIDLIQKELRTSS